VLVLIYDDFRHDNSETIRRVLRFLGVDERHPIEEVNVKKTVRGMRSQPLDDLLRSVSQGQSLPARATRAAVKALTPRSKRREAFRATRNRAVLREVPPLDEQLTLELRRRYAPEVVALSEYLDRDLVALWGYDGLA
jgi:ribosomal protein L12E/L44/L45/RPP1/RPP2